MKKTFFNFVFEYGASREDISQTNNKQENNKVLLEPEPEPEEEKEEE